MLDKTNCIVEGLFIGLFLNNIPRLYIVLILIDCTKNRNMLIYIPLAE